MAASPPTFRRHAALTASVLSAIAFTLGSASAAGATPKPAEPELRAELARLNKKVDKLIESYAAKRESLRKARLAEEAAQVDLRKAEETYAKASEQVDSIAQLRYQSSAADLPALLFAPDMEGAVVMEQLIAQRSAYLRDFAQSRDLKKQAAEKAARLTEQIGVEAKVVETERQGAERVIRDIERKLDQLVPMGSGRRADGSWVPQLPTGGDNITDRTRIMLEAIKERFKLPHEVGCYRTGGNGEHPLGRACDFMMSTGGSMPSAENIRLGDEISAWAVKNKDRLGVKYVIWRQRINMGSGWRAMSNRGGITANHYDHPHISMY